VKVTWDYAYYWGVLCSCSSSAAGDLKMLSRVRDELNDSKALNSAMQDFLRDWSARSERRNHPVMLDQLRLRWFTELNRGLRDRSTTKPSSTYWPHDGQLRQLAGEIVATATAQHPGLDAAGAGAARRPAWRPGGRHAVRLRRLKPGLQAGSGSPRSRASAPLTRETPRKRLRDPRPAAVPQW